MNSAPARRRRHFARQWHRWLGLLAALPLLWLAISGFILNHADLFGINERTVSTGWILRHYHQLPEGEPSAITTGDRLVAEWEGIIFLDSKTLTLHGSLVGAEALKGQLVIATADEIGIFDGSDDLLLQLDELSLPALPIEAIAVRENRLLVAANSQWFRLSEDFFTSEEVPAPEAVRSPGSLEVAQRKSLEDVIQHRNAMPLHRVLGDAHSGSLFGWPGWLLSDLTALSVITLTILGLRLYPKRRS